MRLTKKEKAICKEYGERDPETGLVGCVDCPLRIPYMYVTCKATCTKEEWMEYQQFQESLENRKAD